MLIASTFKRPKRGTYFWSLVVSTISLILYTTANMLLSLNPIEPVQITLWMSGIGWIGSSNGFSLVLWSRLHLITVSRQIRILLLVMIMTTGVVLQGTTLTITQIQLAHPTLALKLISGNSKLNCAIQIAFATQETLLSSVYIYYVIRFLRSGFHSNARNAALFLLFIHCLIICVDVILTSLPFTQHQRLAQTLYTVSYALKLRFEFIVLNQLKTYARLLVQRNLTSTSEPTRALTSNMPADDYHGAAISTFQQPAQGVPDSTTEQHDAHQSVLVNRRSTFLQQNIMDDDDSVGIATSTFEDQLVIGDLPAGSPVREVSTDESLEAQYLGRWNG